MLHLVGYLPIQYYKDARYHEHKILGLIAKNGTGVKNIDFDNRSGCQKIYKSTLKILLDVRKVVCEY